AATARDIEEILADPDPYVREKAVAGFQAMTDSAAVRRLVARAFGDTAPIVRFRSVAFYARRLRPTDGCAPLATAARDVDAHVALAAIDALNPCRADPGAVALLDSLAMRGAAPRCGG